MSIEKYKRYRAWEDRFFSENTIGWKSQTWIEHQNNAIIQLHRYINFILESKDIIRVLELGSGSGRVVAELSKIFPQITFIASDFIDIATNSIASDLDLLKIKTLTIDAYDVKESDLEEFDLIFSVGDCSILSHKNSLENILPKLKKGTFIICDFINHNSFKFYLRPWIILKVFVRYLTYKYDQSGKTIHFYKFGIHKFFKKFSMEIDFLEVCSYDMGMKRPIFVVAHKL